MLKLFIKGGPLMWPLLITSLITLTATFERLLFWYREKRRRQAQTVRTMLEALRANNVDDAIEAGELSADYRARSLVFGLKNRAISFSMAYQQQAARELRSLGRGASILDTVITLAPLMGLLGTVTGMIHAFGLMGANELDAPTAITGGIAEALIATAFGLGIAICALVPFNWLNTKLEQAQHELQDIGTQAELLLAQQSQDSPILSEVPRSDYAALARRS
jgi:biopolymer transport protein ExbB